MADDRESRLLATVQALIEAERQADIAALERIIAPDYLGFDPAGLPQDREALLSGYHASGVRVEALEPADLRIRLFGDVGLVSGRTRIAGRALGERFELRLRFLDVFVRREGAWQLVASQVTPVPVPGA
jgi:ketosteroid isomerase-like protein